MKILIAPDSFKGSLSAMEVANSIEKGINKVINDAVVEKVPMADGGEGTVQSLVDATNGEIISIKVKDPLLREITASYGILGDKKTAVIEMAAASGLPLLLKDERNPLLTTTYGTGELIRDALDKGCRNIIIGIGGSATNDGGFGMLIALGAKFLDHNGKEIGFGGGNLGKLHKIDLDGMDPRIKECTFTAACDVDNPLCGPRGASYIFGPQKGADENTVEILDENLMHYALVIKDNFNIDIRWVQGAGAAGGLGGGLYAFLNAELKRGIEIVISITELEKKVREADLVFTGEGMIDLQTTFGKTPYGVAKVAKKYGVPVIAIAGSIGKDTEVLYEKGFDSIFPILDKPMNLEEAMTEGKLLVENTAERIMRIFKISIHS